MEDGQAGGHITGSAIVNLCWASEVGFLPDCTCIPDFHAIYPILTSSTYSSG